MGAVLERVDDKLSKQKLSGAVTDVEWEHVKASVTSMAFFDRLEVRTPAHPGSLLTVLSVKYADTDTKSPQTCDPPLVRSGGRLAQCMEEVFDDITVSDELRKMLVTEARCTRAPHVSACNCSSAPRETASRRSDRALPVQRGGGVPLWLPPSGIGECGALLRPGEIRAPLQNIQMSGTGYCALHFLGVFMNHVERRRLPLQFHCN